MIRVEISWLDFVNCPPHLREMTIVDLLRQAGIPVIGILLLRGIVRGTLIKTEEARKIVYTFLEGELGDGNQRGHQEGRGRNRKRR
jgi:hypothetical protein